MVKRFLSVVALSCLACATPKPRTPPPPMPPLPRSSIAAVLEHRGELALTEDQVQRLESLDQKLQEDNAALRDQLMPKRDGDEKPRGEHGSGGGMGAGGPGMSMGGMGGMGGGMGGMGGGRGMGGMGGGRGGGRHGGGLNRPATPDEESRMATLRDRIDSNDTQAYLDAEGVLTEAQKPRAREIASKYREDLWQRRETMRKWREGQGG